MKTNMYKEMRNRFQSEFTAFPMVFAFSSKQQDEAMLKLGLTPTEIDKVCPIGGGGFILKSDVSSFHAMVSRHTKEKADLIAADTTGDGFIYDMFLYELINHEYGYTYDLDQTLDALGYTQEQIKSNPALARGLKKATKRVRDMSQ